MTLARLSALLGWVGLLLLWIAWSTFLASPTQQPPTWIVAGFTVIPLLALLPSLILDRRGGYLGLGMLSLLYFIHGVGAATDPEFKRLAQVEIFLSFCLFGGAVWRLKQLNQS